MKRENRETVIAWSKILTPQEMNERFGSYFSAVRTAQGDVYINSSCLVEAVLESGPQNAAEIIQEIPRAYLSLAKRTRTIENKKH